MGRGRKKKDKKGKGKGKGTEKDVSLTVLPFNHGVERLLLSLSSLSPQLSSGGLEERKKKSYQSLILFL